MSNQPMELVQKYKIFVQYGVILILSVVVYNAWNSYDLIFVPIDNTQMSPAFEPNNFRVGQRLTKESSIEYGDIVYYQFPHEKTLSRKEHLFFSRVVGKPGDVIELKEGTLYRNGQKVEESYVSLSNKGQISYFSTLVPNNRYFLLNDNRKKTGRDIYFRDSRFWGAIHRTSLVGRITE